MFSYNLENKLDIYDGYITVEGDRIYVKDVQNGIMDIYDLNFRHKLRCNSLYHHRLNGKEIIKYSNSIAGDDYYGLIDDEHNIQLSCEFKYSFDTTINGIEFLKLRRADGSCVLYNNLDGSMYELERDISIIGDKYYIISKNQKSGVMDSNCK